MALEDDESNGGKAPGSVEEVPLSGKAGRTFPEFSEGSGGNPEPPEATSVDSPGRGGMAPGAETIGAAG
jgi:hypothetical protein